MDENPFGPVQLYETPPPEFRFKGEPSQTGLLEPIVGVGGVMSCVISLLTDVWHPLSGSVIVTEYVPGAVALIEVPVAPVDHRYVKLLLFPELSVADAFRVIVVTLQVRIEVVEEISGKVGAAISCVMLTVSVSVAVLPSVTVTM